MKKLNFKTRKSQKGITLIALVITIIILLILAGIAIASLTGDNGLFARANQARQNTLDAQNKENATLEGYEDAIDYVLGQQVTNPEGAMPTGATVIQGNADEGIVIRDENGNEWVWVEVPRTAEIYPTVGINLDVENITDEQCNTIYEDLKKYVSVYRQDGYEDTFYSTEQHGFVDANSYNTAKNNMLRSIYKNGGFWIGRYEVGDADATENNTTRTNSSGILNRAVIQANQIPYNYVTCIEAQEISARLSTGGKTSSLMFGIQWDLTCKFLEKSGLTISQIRDDSTNWGNYNNSSIILSRGKYNISPGDALSLWALFSTNTENYVTNMQTNSDENYNVQLTTGASEDLNKMNIYDFAGNLWEWTLEYTGKNSNPCSRRGVANSASHHSDDNTTHRSNGIGLRTSLY